MTRRERAEARLERRQEWAENAQARGEAHLDTAHKMGDLIPFGQPILVGHHREKADRRYRGRIDGHMDHGVAELKKAEHHTEKAKGIERQLERSVYSDDVDAIEALEARIAETEAKANTLAGYNKAWRKHKSAEGMIAEGVPMMVAAQAVVAMKDAYSWVKSPFSTDHLRAAIRRDKARIEEIRAQQIQHERAEASGAVLIEVVTEPDWMGRAQDAVRVTFPEKPDREIIDALKAAGFFWSAPSWHGKASALPQIVAEMADPQD